MNEEYVYHPSMFRSNPVGFLLSLILCFAYGAGLVILGIWWLKVKNTSLIVTPSQTIFRKGIFTSNESEINNKDIRNIISKQSIGQKLMGVYYLGISTAGTGGIEIQINGIKDAPDIKKLLNGYREAINA